MEITELQKPSEEIQQSLGYNRLKNPRPRRQIDGLFKLKHIKKTEKGDSFSRGTVSS